MNNFNLKKFLTENKLTSLSNDKGINENLSPAEQEKVSSELSNYVEKHKPDFGEVAEIDDGVYTDKENKIIFTVKDKKVVQSRNY